MTKPTIFVVSTPIGNLGDITYRAVNTLENVDLILCEDTRVSIKLLNHYNIKKPLKSYHKFNEKQTFEGIIDNILEGQSVALISDGGTPLISDPGYILIEQAIKHNIDVVVIPGANAILPSLILSAFDTQKFTFFGFLPKKNTLLKEMLKEILLVKHTSVVYVSKHNVCDILLEISNLSPDRNLALSKELTKIYENVYRGNATQILEELPKEPKGEYVLVIEGNKEVEKIEINYQILTNELEELYSQGINKNEALKIIAKQYSTSKNILYKLLISSEE